MIYIKKVEEFNKFKKYKETSGARFNEIPGDLKAELRKELQREQGKLCAYCMCRIENDRDTKIEHYCARNLENELDYHNLLAVCYGNEKDKIEGVKKRLYTTCDTHKRQLKLNINPLNKEHMDTIFL